MHFLKWSADKIISPFSQFSPILFTDHVFGIWSMWPMRPRSETGSLGDSLQWSISTVISDNSSLLAGFIVLWFCFQLPHIDLLLVACGFFLAVWSWASYLNSLCPTFPICIVRKVWVSTHLCCYENKLLLIKLLNSKCLINVNYYYGDKYM